MQKMCWCILLAAAFVALADGHSLTALKAHRSRRAVVELTTQQKKILVDKHNELRRLVGASDMEKMIWDDELASMAVSWAAGCVYTHGHPANATKGAGQNLYGKYGLLPFDVAHATQLWYDEVKDYTYYNRTCVTGAKCGHYTQVVWAESRELGCGYARCAPLRNFMSTEPADYLVCNYGPAGNNVAEHPYKKGAVCSACRSSGWCQDGLCNRDCTTSDTTCECDLNCANGGVFDESTCSCTCKNGWMGTDCTRECKDYDERCPNWTQASCNNANGFVLERCPLKCGHCAPGCHNSGVFNEETKSCDCAQGWTGVDCSRVCKNDDDRCGNGWPKHWCDDAHPYVGRNCPLMCGLCVPECQNSGVFNEETQSCDCAKRWMGADCTSECKDESNLCGHGWPKRWCGDAAHSWIQDRCPLMCGLCEK